MCGRWGTAFSLFQSVFALLLLCKTEPRRQNLRDSLRPSPSAIRVPPDFLKNSLKSLITLNHPQVKLAEGPNWRRVHKTSVNGSPGPTRRGEASQAAHLKDRVSIELNSLTVRPDRVA
jgi:hypothetical protein